MENLELFDKYIKFELPEKETEDFKKRLESDKEFSKDFKVYLTTIHGIAQEAEQDGVDFAHAMKNVSKEELHSIIGATPGKVKTNKAKIIRMRIGWVASVAAVVAIAFTVCFDIQRSANYQVDDVLYSGIEVPMSNRGGGTTFDMDAANEDQLKPMLTEMENLYKKASDSSELYIYGMNLAKGYLKLHDRENAIRVLENLKSRCVDDEEIVSQCDKILKNIK